ncbi:MAG: hypothetical protein WKG07_39015 [Hymenobacter sp.]
MVCSIPRRSVVGFWQGASPEFVTADSLPLSETERTLPPPAQPDTAARPPAALPRGLARGWRARSACVAAPDSAERTRRYPPAPLVLAQWRGLRVAFVSGSLRRLAASPTPRSRPTW